MSNNLCDSNNNNTQIHHGTLNDNTIKKPIPLVNKYRPRVLEDILGNEIVINTLLKLNDNIPNLLFYGPPGTGKTTTILAICHKLYNNDITNILELNASDERGISIIRERIKSFAATISFNKKKKIIILDEADSMSKDAQNALRRIIEDYSNNVRFCLIANYVNKIILPIQSRCCKFRFKPVKSNLIKNRIMYIMKSEKIYFSNECVDVLVEECQGDMRRLINSIDGFNYMEKYSRENMNNKVINTSNHILDNINSNIQNNDHTIDNNEENNKENDCINDQLNKSSIAHNQLIVPVIDFSNIIKLCKDKDFDKAYDIMDNVLQDVDYITFFDKLTVFILKEYKGSCDLLATLGDIEHRISIGCMESLQIKCMLRILHDL